MLVKNRPCPVHGTLYLHGHFSLQNQILYLHMKNVLEYILCSLFIIIRLFGMLGSTKPKRFSNWLYSLLLLGFIAFNLLIFHQEGREAKMCLTSCFGGFTKALKTFILVVQGLDFVVDGGVRVAEPSTVVDMTKVPPRVLRQGKVVICQFSGYKFYMDVIVTLLLAQCCNATTTTATIIRIRKDKTVISHVAS